MSIILVSNVVASSAIACSGFTIAKDSTVVVCKNTDATDWKSKIWFTPPTDTTFGYVCFGFDYPYLSDGMNDRGLVVSHFSGHEKQITKSIHKPVYGGVLSELVLATCGSVQDVKILLQKYNLGLFHNGMIMYSDRYGNSMIVEGDTIIEKKHFYQICMNTYQSEYNEDTHPFWNQVPAKQMIPLAADYSDSTCLDILQHMQNDLTQYSIIYDIKRLRLFVYLFHDFNRKVEIDLLDRLKNGSQIYDLSTLFPAESPYYQVYVKRQAPQNNVFLLLTLILCGILFLYTIIVWPSAKLLRGTVVLYSYTVCILLFLYLIVLANFKEAFQIGLPPRIDNFPFFLKMIVHIPFTVGILLIPMIIMNFRILMQSDRSRVMKWNLTINTISYMLLLGLFAYWGFIKLYI